MRFNLFAFTVALTFCLFSCGAPKDVTYLQGIDSVTPAQLEEMSQTYVATIKKDDILNIAVSAWDPLVATPFNPPAFAYAQEGDQPIASTQTMFNYTVDKEGYINFPVLGKIHVEGLTRTELADKLQKDISAYIDDPLVNVQIINFRVIVMGEVLRPGSYTVRGDRFSILDLIGSAGDLTITGNRKNILIIRDNNGVKQFERIDMTDPALFASPFYYLQQNDIVYIEPNDAKKKNYRHSQEKQYNITVFSTVVSSVSIITSLVITLVSLNKKSNN